MRAWTRGFFAVSIVVAGSAYGQEPFDYQAVDVPCDAGAPTFCPGGVAPQTAVMWYHDGSNASLKAASSWPT
jgi:hypothetical protein